MRLMLQAALLLISLSGGLAHADTVLVLQLSGRFSPEDLTIQLGDKVTWVHVSGNHTVTEGQDAVLDGTEAFHSLLNSQVTNFSVTFDAAFLAAHPRTGDVYHYVCIPHIQAGMIGTVTVELPATRYCFGDGSDGTDCPCSNNSAVGARAGCLNSLGRGAVLTPQGTASFAADDFSMLLTDARPGQPAMFLQGASQVAAPFKDGKLCVGNPTERLEVVFLDSVGAGSTIESVVTNGDVPGPGATRYYQAWYRDPSLAVCGERSNLSNGLIVDWI